MIGYWWQTELLAAVRIGVSIVTMRYPHRSLMRDARSRRCECSIHHLIDLDDFVRFDRPGGGTGTSGLAALRSGS